MLSEIIRTSVELNLRPALKRTGHKPGKDKYMFALGGWMVAAKGIKLKGSEETTKEGMNRIDGKVLKQSNDKVIGHTVKQPLGWDLMPSWSKDPTPIWKFPKWRTMIPPSREDQKRMIDFAKTHRELTKDYVFESKSVTNRTESSRVKWEGGLKARIPMPFGLPE